MGTAVAEKIRFTCLSVRGGNFVSVKATDPDMADKKADFASILIIQGTAGDIGAKRVEGCFSSLDLDGFSLLKKIRGELEEGTICTIIVEDPVRITDATYCGTQGISGYTFLAFTKNGVRFWLFSEATAYLKI